MQRGRPSLNLLALLSSALLLVSAPAVYAAQSADAPEPLSLHKPVRKTLSGGKSHRYSVSVALGQFVRIQVDQYGIDTVSAAFLPSGEKFVESDVITGSRGSESILIGSKEGSVHQIEVRSLDAGSVPGEYEIRLAELHAIEPRDELRLKAQSLQGESMKLWMKRTAAAAREAVSQLEASIQVFRSAGDTQGELYALLYSNLYLRPQARYREIVQYSRQALALAQRVSDIPAEAVAGNQLGMALAVLGDAQLGLDHLEKSMALWRKMSDRHGTAFLLNQIGNIYRHVGDSTRALDYYRQALEISRALNERELLGGALISFGTTLCELDRAQEGAPHLLDALPLYKSVNDVGNQSVVLHELGICKLALGETEGARRYFDESLALSRKAGRSSQIASTLAILANHYRTRGEYDQARGLFTEALEIRRATGDPVSEAQALGRLARLETEAGRLDEALRLSRTAIDLIEPVRSRIGSFETRAARLEASQSIYGITIDALYRLNEVRPGQGYDAMALEISEQARARGLLEMLQEAQVDIREGVSAELQTQEKSLLQALDEKAREQRRVLGPKGTPAEREAVAEQFRALLVKLDDVRARMRASNPRYAALEQPSAASVAEIQQQLLDEDTLLIEYFLGPERSYVWVVTRDLVAVQTLPSGKVLTEQARAVYKALSTSQSGLTRAQPDYPRLAAELSASVLAPIAAHLKPKRWIVVTNGALQYVPFAALPVPGSNKLVVEEHEVVYLPSASVLSALRKERQERGQTERRLAILADPVFESADPRLARKQSPQQEASRVRSAVSTTRSDTSWLGDSEPQWQLSRLPFTRREAEAIRSAAPEGSVRVFTDFDASLTTVSSGELSRYAFIHFATHGFYDSNFPELSGLVLSLVNKRGDPTAGFLRLHDVYRLRLNAELVVLSACQTGLGKPIGGEGFVGLTRGMMYAGASRVAASLWKVDDSATAELMKHFYEGMLKSGMTPAASLRSAQLKLLGSKRWRDPYYWAAFLLQGDYR